MLNPTSAPLWSQGLGPAESGMHILRAPSRRGVQNQKCLEMFRIRREIGSRRRWAFLLINQRVDLFRVLKVWLSEKDGETKCKKRESREPQQMIVGMFRAIATRQRIPPAGARGNPVRGGSQLSLHRATQPAVRHFTHRRRLVRPDGGRAPPKKRVISVLSCG